MSARKRPTKKPEEIPDKQEKDLHHRNYSLDEKVGAILWVLSHPGRGAISKAAKKFAIVYNTLHGWINDPLKEHGKNSRAKPKKRGRPKGSFNNILKYNIEKIEQEAHATDVHLHELMEKLGWPGA